MVGSPVGGAFVAPDVFILTGLICPVNNPDRKIANNLANRRQDMIRDNHDYRE
jgi:hypothetical protein